MLPRDEPTIAVTAAAGSGFHRLLVPLIANRPPAEGSIAARELAAAHDREDIETAHYSGLIQWTSAADHLDALCLLLGSEAPPAIAPATVVRGGIEAAALAYWILDPSLSATQRASRGFGWRRAELQQDVGYLIASMKAGLRDPEATGHATEHARSRIRQIEERCRLAHIRILKPPDPTQAIRQLLKEEYTYNLLSRYAHASPRLVGLTASRALDQHETVRKVELRPGFACWLTRQLADSLSKTAWRATQLFGWSREELTRCLELGYDELSLEEDRRFWRAV